MGITLHYSGVAKSHDAIRDLMNTAQLFAAEREWMMAMYEDPLGIYEDIDPDDPGYIEKHGPYRGIVLRPHKNSEAVRLCFNFSREFDGSTKTQFAPFTIHRQIVELFRRIAPFLESFEVIDESEYWETGDEETARERFAFLGTAIDAMGEEIGADGPDTEQEWGGVPKLEDDEGEPESHRGAGPFGAPFG